MQHRCVSCPNFFIIKNKHDWIKTPEKISEYERRTYPEYKGIAAGIRTKVSQARVQMGCSRKTSLQLGITPLFSTFTAPETYPPAQQQSTNSTNLNRANKTQHQKHSIQTSLQPQNTKKTKPSTQAKEMKPNLDGSSFSFHTTA